MMRKMVVIAVPSLGTVSIEWAAAYSDLCWPMNYAIGKIFVKGKTVAEARNETVARAFDLENAETTVSHIFWLDDDVLAPPGSIVALMRRRVPIVSGVYFAKMEPSEPLIFPGPLAGSDEFVPDQFRPVWGHGMGLTLIEMDVYRKMSDGLGKDQYGYPQWYRTLKNEATNLDGQEIVVSSSEDLYFLDAAAKFGYQPHIDTTRHCFGWHFDRITGRAFPSAQWKEFKAKGTITWDTAAGPVTWS